MCPAIYIINLDRSVARLRKAQMSLEARGLKYNRVSAIDGAQEDLRKSPYYDVDGNSRDYFEPVSSCLIGNFLSHRKTWKLILKGESSHSIVLEDDFCIHRDALPLLNQLGNEPLGYDILRLYTNRKPKRILYSYPDTPFHMVAAKRPPIATVAYLISKEGAKKLLDATETITRPLDVHLKHWWEFDLKAPCIWPSVFWQDDSPSAITDRISISAKTRIKRIFWRWQYTIAILRHGATHPYYISQKITPKTFISHDFYDRHRHNGE